MRVLLAGVGALLLLDAGLALLMVAGWAARGHAPDFLTLSLYGVASTVMVALKTAGGVAAAVQLFRFRPSGRVIAGVVLAYDVIFTLYAALRADKLGPAAWATMALNAAALLVVALPAAGEACRPRVFPSRTQIPHRRAS